MEEWKLKPAADLGLAPTERLRSARRESGLLETIGHLGWWSAVQGYITLFHRLEIHGRERLPLQPPFVLAANHTSHLDTLALASSFPWKLRDRIYPIAAGDTFFQNPAQAVFSAYALNALPVWRRRCGAHSVDDLRARLMEEDCAFILFPEGTRARNGQMAKFKPGLGLLVAGTSIPVIPCHIKGAFEAWPAGHRVPRPAKIVVRVGMPLCFQHLRNEKEGWISVAAEAENAVRQLSDPAGRD